MHGLLHGADEGTVLFSAWPQPQKLLEAEIRAMSTP